MFTLMSKANQKDTYQEKEEIPSFAVLDIANNEDSSVDASIDEEDTWLCRKKALPPPTEEEMQAEERRFAIACALMEIAQTRSDLHKLWMDWATNTSSSYSEQASWLVASACSMRYAIQMIRKIMLSTSIQFKSFDDFDWIQTAYQESKPADVQLLPSISVGTSLTLCCLQKAELNGKRGELIRPMKEGRYSVLLVDAANREVLLIKPENLIPSNDTFLCLGQVQDALSTFDFELIPQYEQYVGARNNEIQALCVDVLASFSDFHAAMGQKEVVAFSKQMIQKYLPLWIVYAHFSSNHGAADAPF